MKFSKLFILLLGLVFYGMPAVADEVTISGAIEGPSSYSVHLNAKSTSFEQSSFNVKVNQSDFYQFRIEAEKYYPSVQTFSHYELAQNDFKLPPISLVAKKKGRVMLAFGGDVMMGRRYGSPHLNEQVLIRDGYEEEDTKKVVAQIKPYLEIADSAAVNLETQISRQTPKERAPKSVTFFSPPETLGALKWAGVDYVTLGNNHVYDYLDEGLISTLKYLKEYDMAYSGAGLNQAEALKPYRVNINSQDYSMLGFVGWEGGFTPNQTASEVKGGSAFGSKENIITTVSKEAKKNRATIVQYHGSLEYTDEPTAMTESRLKTAIDIGADLVLAHHPHVTQGFELYKGKLIAYSLGNFIFDQYYHAPPHTFVLYVWMDGEEFYRAEVVPVYIKGYMPTPATGIQRNTISKRVNHLSNLRGLNSEASGGHLLLTAEDTKQKQSQIIQFTKGQVLQPLYSFPVQGQIVEVNAKENLKRNNRYRLGVNLVNGGDFESYKTFDSSERGWFLDNLQLNEEKSFDGKHALKIQNTKEVAKVGMKTFRRVFKAGNPMSYQASIFTNQKVSAKLYFQRRKKRDKFSKALKNKPVLLAEKLINPSENWQTINFDFNTPRVGYRSYRVWLEIESSEISDRKNNYTYLDQVALVEWQAHFNAFGELPRNKDVLGLSTYLGLEQAAEDTVEVEVIYK